MNFIDLYFKDAQGNETLVLKGLMSVESAIGAAEKDLKTRRPDFKHYYIRWFETVDGDIMIDYGSHSEFYIVRMGI